METKKGLILVGPGEDRIGEAMRQKAELNNGRVFALKSVRAEIKVCVFKSGPSVTQVTVCGLQLANGTTEYAANLLARRLGEERYGVFEVPTGKYETREVLE